MEKVNILLVDDSPEKLLAIESVLTSLDENLVKVSSGDEALKYLLNQEFAIILLDVHMPGIGGLEVAELIRGRKATRNTPILFITAEESNTEFLRRAYSLGLVDFLPTPMVPEILKAKVSAHVELYRNKHLQSSTGLEAQVAERTRALEQSKQKLQRSEERYRLLVEAAKDYAIFFMDTKRTIVEWSPGAEQIMGWTAEEAIGKPGDMIFTPEDRAQGIPEKESMAALANEQAPNERWHVRKDGSRFWGSGRMVALVDGTHRGFAKIMRDRTETKRHREALKASEERFRTMADSAPVFIWLADPDKRRHYSNKPYLHFVGRSIEQVTGNGWVEDIHPEDRERCVRIHDESFNQRQPFQMEYRLRRHDGQFCWVTGNGVPLYSSDGTFNGYIGSCLDVSAMKKTEQELETQVSERTAKLKEAVKQLEAFAYTVSHDLRAPVRAVRGFSEALLEDCAKELSADALDYLRRIGVASARMDQMINDVLSYSRISRIDVELGPVDLEKLIDSLILDYAMLDPDQARIEIARPLLSVLGNEAHLTQVVLNLLSNAVKFVPEGVKPEIRIWTKPEGANVRLYIQDNGIGIAASNQERIFGIFERLHTQDEYEGTGVGLAIVKKAIEKIGGSVGVESGVAKGSTFWIQLPGVKNCS